MRCKSARTLLIAAAAALSLLLASCAANPEKAKLNFMNKGQAFMKNAQYSSAAIEFRNAVKIDPKYVEAYYQLAKADLALRDGNAAFNALNQAISIDPNRVDARVERARLLLSAKQFSPALEDINFVLKQQPNNVQAHRLLGSVYVAQKEFDKALQEFSLVQTLAPNDATSYLDVALLNMQLHHNRSEERRVGKEWRCRWFQR